MTDRRCGQGYQIRRQSADLGGRIDDMGNAMSGSHIRQLLPLPSAQRHYLDPGLPLAYLPDPWPAEKAAQLMDALRARLAPLAQAHVDAVTHAA